METKISCWGLQCRVQGASERDLAPVHPGCFTSEVARRGRPTCNSWDSCKSSGNQCTQTLKGASLVGRGLWSSPPASSVLPRVAGAVPWARSSWRGRVAPWVAEPRQVRPEVAQGWGRSCTAGRRGFWPGPHCLLAESHPATPPFPQNSPSQGVLWTVNPSIHPHI